MGDIIASAGDPLFYLHRTWVDKLWWDWQNHNLSSRLYDMGRRNRSVQDSGNDIDHSSLNTMNGDPGSVTMLDDNLFMFEIVPDTTIREVMDTRTEPLCYEYVQPHT